MALRERLVGLALIAAGLVSLGVVYWFWQHRADLLPQPPLPPGMSRTMMPMLSPFDCVIPVTALGATAMTVEGFRRLLFPDDSGPEH